MFLGRMAALAGGALLAPLHMPAPARAAEHLGSGRLDLLTATPETFIPHVGTRFALSAAQGPGFPATLREVEVAPSPTPGNARSFSLSFEAWPRQPVPQGTYAVRHAQLGSFDLFVVPAGRSAPDRTYHAVISHI
jgi:hypothetical protein